MRERAASSGRPRPASPADASLPACTGPARRGQHTAAHQAAAQLRTLRRCGTPPPPKTHARELALGNGLAGKGLVGVAGGLFVFRQPGGAKLATAQHLAQMVLSCHVLPVVRTGWRSVLVGACGEGRSRQRQVPPRGGGGALHPTLEPPCAPPTACPAPCWLLFSARRESWPDGPAGAGGGQGVGQR